MYCKLKMQFKKLRVLVWMMLLMVKSLSASSNDTDDHNFIFSNGFSEANLSLDGAASITPNGLLKLTMDEKQQKGHAFFPKRIPFRRSPVSTNISSFSTTFAFAIISDYSDLSGHGIVFFISPTMNFSTAIPSQFFGLFNPNNNGNSSNHIFAVELDTIQNSELLDIDDDHVGIDINGVRSNSSHHAGYFDDLTGEFHNLSLYSGEPMQAWVDYDAAEMKLNVTISPLQILKPKRPLLSLAIDLSGILLDSMFVGFSSSTGTVAASHYLLGWSFKINGLTPEALNISALPSLPKPAEIKGKPNYLLPVVVVSAVLLIIMASVIIFMKVRRRRMKFAELVEDWELQYGPQRLSYKALFEATKGFKDKQVLGTGGFGKVYKGTLPKTDTEVAVKRVSNDSRQGMREFIAEIASLGRLRHRNIVQLIGYCRRKDELLLVYEYMPNGSLDKLIHSRDKPALNWSQRLHIIKGVAAGLEYLHEDCEQIVIHRDIKTNNVLLDAELNGRLGDFGLARLYDHGDDLQTTHVVGTMGYLAPELARTGRATKLTDVFAFGVFVLEVVCGKRPIQPKSQGDHQQMVLVDWVVENWQNGTILDTRDPRLGEESYMVDDLELVLELGLLCSHPLPTSRPAMKQVVQYLNGDAPLPQLSFTFLSSNGYDELVLSPYPVSGSTPVRYGDQSETMQDTC